MENWVKTSGCRLQVAKRFERFKERVEHYWKLYPWLMCVVACIMFASCRSQQIIVPNDTTTTTTTKTKSIQRDSIYIHDSIYVREYIKGDTVFRDKLVEHFKDRWLTRTDTLMQHDTTVVTQTITQTVKEKYIPKFYKWCTGLLILILIVLIGCVVYKFWKKKINIISILKKVLSL